MAEGGNEIKSGELLGRGAENNYLRAPYGTEAEREFLLGELETACLHCNLVGDMLRKTWNTANSRGLDQQWPMLGLMLDHLRSDLRYVEAEIKKIRDSS